MKAAGPLAASVAAVVLCMGAGCAPFATLDRVIVGDQLAGSGQLSGVRIQRQGRAVPAALDMPLFAGDDICTEGASSAWITFHSGTRLLLEPGTHVCLLNPGIRVMFGRFFAWVSGHFYVRTPHTVVESGNTLFFVSVDRNGEGQVVVLDGRVTLRPTKPGQWPVVNLGPRQAARTTARGRPEALTPKPAEIDAINQRADRVQRILAGEKPQPPVGHVGRVMTESIERSVRRVAVPNLIGATVKAANDALAKAGLRPGRLSYTEAGTGRVGTVVGQDPKAGTTVPAGSTVDLVVRGIR